MSEKLEIFVEVASLLILLARIGSVQIGVNNRDLTDVILMEAVVLVGLLEDGKILIRQNNEANGLCCKAVDNTQIDTVFIEKNVVITIPLHCVPTVNTLYDEKYLFQVHLDDLKDMIDSLSRTVQDGAVELISRGSQRLLQATDEDQRGCH